MADPGVSPRTWKTSINLTDILTDLTGEIVRRTDLFRHIDMERVVMCVSSNRGGRGGTFGKLVPLRFRDGADLLRYRGGYYAIPRVVNNGIPQLYAVYFYVPRFFDLGPAEKLRVLFHELYHIGPAFNGDIRRMGGVKASHGSSRKRFDAHFEGELRDFIGWAMRSPHKTFLESDMRTLRKGFDRIYARRMKMPRPVRIEPGREAAGAQKT